MSDGRAWQGNVKARLYERVRERGYDSLTAFAEARPTATLVELADELGPEDIAAVQVFSGLVAEAERSGKVTRLVRGQLVREPRECLPNGWPAAGLPSGVGCGGGMALGDRPVLADGARNITGFGGEISATSELGRGSTFRISLPAIRKNKLKAV